jgi:hypothetical protein
MSEKQLFLQYIFESDALTLVEINFEQWFALPESSLIDGLKGQFFKRKMKEWIIISEHPNLKTYLHQVNIGRVDTKNQKPMFYKINGRARKILWESGDLEKPDTLTAQIIPMTEPELALLTDFTYPVHIKAAVKKNIVDYYQELGLSFQSPRLKNGNIAESLNISLRGAPAHLQNRRAYKEIDLKRAIELFREELLLLDQLNLDHNVFVTGVLAAALIFLSLDKNNIEFFRKLNQGETETRNDSLDPVGALTRMIHYLKNAPGTQPKIQVELCAKTANCVLAFQKGPESNKYWIKQLRNIELTPHIRAMRKAKGIIGEKEL